MITRHLEKFVNVRLSATLTRKLDRAAADFQVNRSELMRRALICHLRDNGYYE